jgi:PAS domain S-box-containing protein
MAPGREDRRFETLLESAPDAILLANAGGRVVLVNRRAEELFGYGREEIVGQPIELLVPERAGVELSGLRRDGSEFPVEISLSPMSEDDEQLTVTVVRDVSERKAAELRFQTLMESAPDGILLTDSDGAIVLANRRAAELFGYDLEELVGGGVDRLVPATFRAAHAGHRGGYAADPHRREMGAGLELSGLRKDGSEFPVEISLSPMTEGEQRLAVTIVRDVSDRRAAEAERLDLARVHAARREAEAAQQQLLHILRDLEAVVWEAETPLRERLSFVGGRVQEMLGYPEERWTQEEGFWLSIVHPDDRDLALLFFQETADTRDDHEYEYRLVAADGSAVRVRDRVRVSRDGEGRAERLRGVTVNVTHQRELEARLRQSQKMEAVGQLAGGIAHDFNNLLTVVSGYATVLARRAADEQTRADVREITAATDRAAQLTRQLLTFSRRGPQAPERVDLNALVRGVETMLKRLIDEDIQLEIQLAEGVDAVEADPGQLEQILVNLVVNARDAISPGTGTIRIETSTVDLDADRARTLGVREGRSSTLVVADDGIGMSPATLSHIFEPFFTTKAPGKGTGLGLATVYGIVEQAGGSVSATSEPGRGSRFVMTLPSADGSPAREPERPMTRTILVVEDEPALRNLVRTVLEGEGYRVLEAGNGREALEVVERHDEHIDLLLTDVVMPELSGPELVAHLRGLRPDTKVLYVSGYADSRLGLRGVAERSVLRKPFSLDELADRVRGLLREEAEASEPWRAAP